MKPFFTLLILGCIAFITSAQNIQDFQALQEPKVKESKSFKDKYFSAWGFSPFLDFGASPGQAIYPAYRTDHLDTASFLPKTSYSSLLSASYKGRYNILEPGDTLAISLKA